MKEREIKIAIQRVVGKTRYSGWTIGITDKPNRRKTEHGNPEDWHQWRADTARIARNVEEYFLDKGMKGAPGGPGTPNYVYIF